MRHKRYHGDTRTIAQAIEHAAEIFRRKAEPVHAGVQLRDHRDPLRQPRALEHRQLLRVVHHGGEIVRRDGFELLRGEKPLQEQYGALFA